MSKARKVGKSDEIKNSLHFFRKTLLDMAENFDKKPLIFQDFAVDKYMLFPTVFKKYSQTGPDIEIRTTGLVAQLLTMISVNNGQNISSNINRSLLDLHTKLSSKNYNVTLDCNKLKEILNELDQILQDV